MSRLRGVLAAAGVVAIAGAVVISCVVTPVATAASSVVLEGESMTPSLFFAAGTVRDSSASGGSALVLSGSSTASKKVTVSASAKVVIRAKGQQCSGAPAMTVKVDGVNVGSSSVTATTWAEYTAEVKIPAGSHTVAVAFTNGFWTIFCSRKLSIDTVTVVPDGSTTTTPPTTTTPVPVTVAPKADLPGWKHLFADDFTKDAPVGSWDNGTDANKVVYVGAQGQQWRTYPSNYLDTYQRRPYRPKEVLSVSNGMLTFDLHPVQGQPAGANPSPILANGSQYQTYGRYSARLRVDNANLSEYHIAWLLWPQSEQWPADGEIDFPEGALNTTAGAFHHYARASGGQDAFDTGAKFTDWHIYTIEWSPGRVRFLLDDAVVMESTNYVPSKPMRWQLQTETNGSGSHRGNLLVDWVSVWSYAG